MAFLPIASESVDQKNRPTMLKRLSSPVNPAAMAAAARLVEAGIRVMSIDGEGAGQAEGPFRLVIRSTDVTRARRLLDPG